MTNTPEPRRPEGLPGVVRIICNDANGNVVRWLQVNLEPKIPYTCIVREGKASNQIVIEVRGRNEPGVVSGLARKFSGLDGLTHIATSGARITLELARELANDHHELGKLLQGGQRQASITMTPALL